MAEKRRQGRTHINVTELGDTDVDARVSDVVELESGENDDLFRVSNPVQVDGRVVGQMSVAESHLGTFEDVLVEVADVRGKPGVDHPIVDEGAV